MSQEPHSFECVCLNCQSGEDIYCEICGNANMEHYVFTDNELKLLDFHNIQWRVCGALEDGSHEVTVDATENKIVELLGPLEDYEDVDGCDEEFMRSIST